MDRQSNPDVVAGEGDTHDAGNPIIPGVKLYSRFIVIKTAGIGTKQIHRPIEKNTGPRYKPHSYSCLLFFFYKMPNMCIGGKTVSLLNKYYWKNQTSKYKIMKLYLNLSPFVQIKYFNI